MKDLPGDPQFSEIVNRLRSNLPTRAYLYMTVCIPVRIALLLLLIFLLSGEDKNRRVVAGVTGLLSIAAIILLAPSWRRTDLSQWWSKRFQVVAAGLILAASIATVVYPKIAYSIPIAFLVSIFGGIVQFAYLQNS